MRAPYDEIQAEARNVVRRAYGGGVQSFNSKFGNTWNSELFILAMLRVVGELGREDESCSTDAATAKST